MSNDRLSLRGITQAFTASAIAPTTGGVATFTVATAVAGALNGEMKALGTGAKTIAFVDPDDGVTVATAPVIAAGEAQLILHCINSAGTYKNLAGGKTTHTSTSGATPKTIGGLSFPNIPTTLLPFAYTIIYVGTSSAVSVTPGTTLWNADANIRFKNVDINTLPSRPLTTQITTADTVTAQP